MNNEQLSLDLVRSMGSEENLIVLQMVYCPAPDPPRAKRKPPKYGSK